MIDRDYVLERLSYKPDTGELVWKERKASDFKREADALTWNKRFAGKIAGCSVENKGTGLCYRTVTINYKPYRVHRLIWLIERGEWPDQIDHIDGNGENNKIENLRSISHAGNMKNCKRRSDNKTGITGVFYITKRREYAVDAVINGTNRRIGYFKDIVSAYICRKKAEAEHGYHKNHGRVAA